ncbi:MAG: sigma-70 family RNA polymerase sigma factor [Oscillospiraceae bacterium]
MEQSEFAQRVEGLTAQLYRTAYLYLGCEADALDAVDETVFLALKALRKLRQPEYFTTWMTRILINVCKAELGRRKRFPRAEDAVEAGEDFCYDALPLREAIGHLPGDLRAVVILRYLTGYTLAETAESLGLPQGTVVTRQRRALALLKLELSEEGLE